MIKPDEWQSTVILSFVRIRVCHEILEVHSVAFADVVAEKAIKCIQIQRVMKINLLQNHRAEITNLAEEAMDN